MYRRSHMVVVRLADALCGAPEFCAYVLHVCGNREGKLQTYNTGGEATKMADYLLNIAWLLILSTSCFAADDEHSEALTITACQGPNVPHYMLLSGFPTSSGIEPRRRPPMGSTNAPLSWTSIALRMRTNVTICHISHISTLN
jgi:hypothetical protein